MTKIQRIGIGALLILGDISTYHEPAAFLLCHEGFCGKLSTSFSLPFWVGLAHFFGPGFLAGAGAKGLKD